MVARPAPTARHLRRRRRVRPLLLRPPPGGLAGALRRDVRASRAGASSGAGAPDELAEHGIGFGLFEMPRPGGRRDRDRQPRTGRGPGSGSPPAPPSDSRVVVAGAGLMRGRGAGQARIRRLAISPSIWRSAST